MSKSAKARKHATKMAEKKRKKAAKKDAYAKLAGTSKKTKRIMRKNRSKLSGNGKHAHLMSYCGNVGCKKCNPSKTR